MQNSHFLSPPIPSHPIPSHPIPSHRIASHPIPSHRIPSHRIPSHRIPPTCPSSMHQGCRMVEMTCEEHDKYAAGTQFITHTVGRVLGKLGLESTPINTKGYETLLNLVENTAGDSFDLYYGLFMYNTNATEELQRLEMAFDALKKQLLDQLHDVLRLQLFSMPPSATALPSSSPPSSSSSHSSSSSRASSPSPLTSPVPRSPTSEQARPSSLPRRPSFSPPASGGMTRGAGNRSSSGNSSGSSSSGFESEGEEWRPKGAAHSQVFVDQEVPGGVVIDGASAAVYSFGDSSESSESEEESGGNGKGKAASSKAQRR
ncbi:unnamed protein product [Closterium sp. NIES-54]